MNHLIIMYCVFNLPKAGQDPLFIQSIKIHFFINKINDDRKWIHGTKEGPSILNIPDDIFSLFRAVRFTITAIYFHNHEKRKKTRLLTQNPDYKNEKKMATFM